MKNARPLIPFRAAVLAAALMASGSAPAAEAGADRVPRPTVKIEKGAKCVEPTDEMRRNHMNMLLHQRDETMRRGIRTPRHSLKGCIECHASPTTNSVVGKDGFCESCHTYAAVRIDCFSCHSASPRQSSGGSKPGAAPPASRSENTRHAQVAAAPAAPAAPASRMCSP